MNGRLLHAALALGFGLWGIGAEAVVQSRLASSSVSETGTSEALSFEHLGERAGLPHHVVSTLLQDQQGFLWMGTWDGLYRYDGYQLTPYVHDPRDSTSLANDRIQALLEDRTGTLWVGTAGGLHRRRGGRFERVPLAGELSRNVSTLLEGRSGDLWVGTRNGLYRYEPTTGRTHQPYLQREEHSGTTAPLRVAALARNRQGTLWIGTMDGKLHGYTAELDAFQSFSLPRPSPTSLRAIYEDTGGTLWIGTTSGLFVFDRGRHRLRPAPVSPPFSAFVRALREDEAGRLWVATERGIYRYDDTKRALRRHPIVSEQDAMLSQDVLALLVDRAGAVWAGTAAGVVRHDPHVKPFHHLGHEPGQPNSLSGNLVTALLEDASGGRWVGTRGYGVNHIDPVTGVVTRHRRQSAPGHLSSDTVYAIYQDSRGRMWMGTGVGLDRFDPRTEQFLTYELHPKSNRPPIFNAVRAIREGPSGQLWLGMHVDGLARFDPERSTFQHYPFTGDSDGPSSRHVLGLHRSRTHPAALWLGTARGLNRFDTDTESFTQYPAGDSTGLLGTVVHAMHEDAHGALWIGTDRGLSRLDPRSETFTTSTPDPLHRSPVNGILQDDEERLWLGTDDGLARYAPSDTGLGQLRVYDAGDGLRNTHFSPGAFLQTRDSTFLFGGSDGVTVFRPDRVHDNPTAPPVVLTQFTKTSSEGVTTRRLHGRDSLILAPRDYAFSFNFAALSFTNPERNQYAYKLDGFDRDWIEAGTRRQAFYTNMPPGQYTFRVKAANEDGHWNEQGAALPITIQPAFWQTTWFWMLTFLLAASLLYAAYRYRVNHLLEVERMRLNIARDLHDDLGSSLSSIALLSDDVRERLQRGEREGKHLVTISRSARTMVDALHELVWAIDPAHDHYADLVSHMKDAAADLLPGIRCHFEVFGFALTEPLDMQERHQLFLLYKEILHNVARHADASNVVVRLTRSHHQLVLVVRDDGIGFEKREESKGTGLKSMRERADKLGGTLTIETAPGEGTTVRLVIEGV